MAALFAFLQVRNSLDPAKAKTAFPVPRPGKGEAVDKIRLRAVLPGALLLLAVGGGTLTSLRSAEAAKGSAIRWRSSYARARAEAKKTRKPVLLEFYADWCGPCKMMEGSTFKNAGVAAETRKMVPVRVNVDHAQGLARQFGVSGIPQSYVLSPRGTVLAGATGYMDADEYRKFLRSGMAKAGARAGR